VAAQLAVREVIVDRPGQVAALNAGLAAISSELVGIVDDDTEPAPDWAERLSDLVQADRRAGGAGGRDVVHEEGTVSDQRRAKRVGIVQSWGRVIGNHHLGVGPVRQVDVLKGCNMLLRRRAIPDRGFDERLRGSGAQMHSDLGLSLAIRRGGWRLLYDPAVLVGHFPAERFDEDRRNEFSSVATRNAAHNETLVLLEHLDLRRRALFLVWAIAVGTRAHPGLLQAVRLRGAGDTLSRIIATLAGRRDALRTWRKG
jgi:GT2 family glycosyltransferase